MRNGIQAIKNGGELKIETVPLLYGKNSSGYVQVVIRDSGEGIAEKNMENIFNPFFTTKEPGKGTGLGLSISHQIIEEHRGTIRIRSEVGKGTTVYITLPIEPEKHNRRKHERRRYEKNINS
jgi:two-component system NtrC family sensor kinase